MEIVIIDHEPFSRRKKDHYYIERFLKDGINVEYWDVSKAVSYSKNVEYQYAGKANFVKIFNSYRDLLDMIGNLDTGNTIIILEIFFRKDTARLYRRLRDLGIKWARISYYHNPTAAFGDRSTILGKIVKMFTFRSLQQKLIACFNSKYTEPDLLFLTGNRDMTGGRKVMSIDFFDVEEYRKLREYEKVGLVEQPYIVFLDIMFANHPDFKRLKVDTIAEDIYYRKMRLFFDRLENTFNMPVIVASHPKASYQDEFGKRTIIKDETARLVRDSKFVVTHGSLSISYALLASKPLLYVYLEEMLANKILSVYYRRMVRACEKLSAEIVSTESDIKDLLLKVDSKKYSAFLQDIYLKRLGDNRSNYKIIKEGLQLLIENENSYRRKE